MERAAPWHPDLHAVKEVVAQLEAAVGVIHAEANGVARVVEAEINRLIPSLGFT